MAELQLFSSISIQ